MSDAMISIPVGKYNELADLVVELTTRHKVLIETNESLAALLAEVEAMLTKRDAHLATYKAMLDETRIQESARRGGELAAVQRAEAAEARVRELEHALRRASERLSWLRDHHCSSEFARGQAKMAADECWRVQAGERATASARAVQEGGNG